MRNGLRLASAALALGLVMPGWATETPRQLYDRYKQLSAAHERDAAQAQGGAIPLQTYDARGVQFVLKEEAIQADLQKLAAGGDADAKLFLGITYLDDGERGQRVANYPNTPPDMRLWGEKGAQEDFDKAIRLFKEAGSQGSASAFWNLGLMYEGGDGVQSSKYIAAEWFYRAALIYVQDGDREHALRALEKLDAIDRESREARDLRERLDRSAPVGVVPLQAAPQSNATPPTSPPFNRDVVEVCIDQKKLMMGDAYAGKEAFVRQTCYCQTDALIALYSSPSGQAKMATGDPFVTALVRQASESCTQDVKHGRRFTPP